MGFRLCFVPFIGCCLFPGYPLLRILNGLTLMSQVLIDELILNLRISAHNTILNILITVYHGFCNFFVCFY